jgi:predicted ATPase/signal transduction histidine kinase
MQLRAGYTFHETLHESPRSMLIRATRTSDGTPVILKLPGNDYLDRRRTLEIQREYAIARRVEGEGIIRVYGVEELSDRVALVLEDIGGRSLRHLLDERGPVDVATFLDYAIRITNALGHIHRSGVIHKDIKPQNIIANPDTGVLKIADFSISVAIALETVNPEPPGSLTGTLAYMAPEQTGRMNRGVDYRADFYALGATFFELLTNHRPFEAETPLELLHAHVARMPPSPREKVPTLPEALAAIVLKLLAKDPDARYQSTWGLVADLEECQRRLRAQAPLAAFELGTADRAQQFRLPQGLYGRASDVELLTSAHARAVAGRAELLLITGSAGIGKSSLVNELHRVTAASRGRFATGKCDPLHRGVPFDAIQQALRHLVRQTIADGETESGEARQRLDALLGVNTSVLVEAVPETRELIGEQPPSAGLPAAETRNRLNRVLARALQAFAMPSRPLVLFLDDLQWADVATLALLQALARDPDNHHVLLVGAWRDTEVSSSHPLEIALEELRTTGTPMRQLRLSPLGPEEAARMVRESTGADTGRALELGQLIHARTGGNPFSIREFLRFLHDQGLLRFDARAGRWGWDLAQIEAREIPNDVAALMADELRRLPQETGELLQLAACLGVVFSFRDLSVVHGAKPEETARMLWTAIEQGFVLPLSRDYVLLEPQSGVGVPADLEVSFRFLHDRVRQTAYTLMPESERAERHTQLGLRLLEDARSAGMIEERAFIILPHLAHAPKLIEPAELRLELADIHLRAGRKAKASGAYRTACELFRAGIVLLPASAWRTDHDRAFTLQMDLAESSYLASEFSAATSGFATLIEQARSPMQKATVLGMQATLASLNSQHVEAMRLGLEGLRLLGVELPSSTDPSAIGAELGAVAEWLDGRSPEELMELPRMRDPNVELSLGLLASIAASAYMADQALFAIVVLRIVRLSLQHGNSRLSAFGYVIYGILLASALDNPDAGRQFGQLAVELSARFRDPMLHARVRYLRAGLIDHWTRSARSGVAELTEAYKGLMESGDWIYAGHCLIVRLWRRVAVGDSLGEILAENRRFIELLEGKKDPDSLHMFLSAHQTLLALTGNEEATAAPPSTMGNTAKAYLTLAAVERHYLMQQQGEALAKAQEVVPLLPFISGLFHVATHAFYHALSAAAVYSAASKPRQEELLPVMEQHRAFLEKCAGRVPENFSAHHLLVSAELLRVTGQEALAPVEYEKAIAAARKTGFLGVEALACELAFRFFAARDRRPLASAYLLESLYAYERWGASGKARLLAAEQSTLLLSHGSALRRWDGKSRHGTLSSTPATERGSTHNTSHTSSETFGESLDLASAMKASQAISSEILFPQLVANLIQVVMESAGAQRGVLVLRRGSEYIVEASGELGRRDVPLEPARPVAQSERVCHAIIEQVLRSGAHVLVDDASTTEPFSRDAYVTRNQVHSVLCAPIRHRGQMLGLFYLENNLTSGAFNASRLKVLGVLSTQASISIENAELYRRLEEYSHTLEDRVADRTAELHNKNSELHRALETLKAMQAQIITQEKLASLGALTAGIAHELKNPLNFVNNFAALSVERVRELRDSMKSAQLPPAAKEDFEDLLGAMELNSKKIREHGQRAVSIIDGMLRHARGTRGERRSINVNQLVEEAVRLVHHGLNAKSARRNVLIETAFDSALPDVNLVSEDIRRVVLNLVENACYAASERHKQPNSAEQARVKVSTRWTGNAVEIRVRDNGKGIPADIREKLFMPFFTTKPTGEGTGLGLSISHEIVVGSLGGKLMVESEEGRYAEFIVLLPGSGQRTSPPV